jgi:hypothetical protein
LESIITHNVTRYIPQKPFLTRKITHYEKEDFKTLAAEKNQNRNPFNISTKQSPGY